MKTIVLSIIIVNYRTQALTLGCLSSVKEFSPCVSYEVILVDNGSNDGIVDEVADKFPDVQLIETGFNGGFSRASNLGIANSHGKYVLLLNSDTRITEPTFDKLVVYMQDHPEVGAVGPYHLDGQGRYQVSYGKFPDLNTVIWHKITEYYRISINNIHIKEDYAEFCSEDQEVDWLSGSCLLLRREALRQVGLLDESFFMYFEDVDLCKRILERGWRIVFFPIAKVIHYRGQSVKENILAGRIAYRLSQIHFARKYYGRKGDYIIRIMLFLKFGAKYVWLLLEFLARKITWCDTQEAYVKMQLSQKIFEVIFQSNKMRPREPILNEFEVAGHTSGVEEVTEWLSRFKREKST